MYGDKEVVDNCGDLELLLELLQMAKHYLIHKLAEVVEGWTKDIFNILWFVVSTFYVKEGSE